MSKLSFDFNHASAYARTAYPDATRNVTFIDLSDADAFMKLKQWYSETYNKPLDPSSKGLAAWLQRVERKWFPDHPKAARFANNNIHSDGFIMETLLAMPSRLFKGNARLTGPDNDTREALFTFFHELGHIVIKAPDKTVVDQQVREIQADLFACVMGLREGWLDVNDVKTVAASREKSADQDHNTSQALHTFIREYETGKYPPRFGNWTAEDVRQFAATGRAPPPQAPACKP